MQLCNHAGSVYSNEVAYEHSDDDPDFIPNNHSDSENEVEQRKLSGENNRTTEEGKLTPCQPKSKGRKRVRKESTWKRKLAKEARLKGAPYKSAVAKKKINIEGRTLKQSCTCKKKCCNNIPEETRKNIFREFWMNTFSWDQRRQFVISMVNEKQKNRSRPRNDSQAGRRKFTKFYHLQIENDKIVVCKLMFLNTLGITEKFVRVALSKKKQSGVATPDERGKHPPKNKLPEEVRESVFAHISSFPVYESHYSREKTKRKYLGPELNINVMYKLYLEKCNEAKMHDKVIAKAWLYRKIFNENFNLSFYQPSNDTCDDCDCFTKQLKESKLEREKLIIEEERKKHHEEANFRYKLKSQDKKEGKESNLKKCVVMIDLQKCLPTPCLSNSRSFYLRKLWTLNLTIHCDTTGQSYCMLWDETQGLRGGNEIASCILKWATQFLSDKTTELTIWSDNCSGQNRNRMLFPAYMWLVEKIPNLEIINHKYLLKGHTHMEADTVHAIIERKRKTLKTLEIAVPRDWAQFISTCGNKNPFVVTAMNIDDFKDTGSLLKGPLVSRKKNIDGEQFYLSHVIWAQIRKSEPGIIFYKTSFQEEIFTSIDLKRNKRLTVSFPSELPKVRDTSIPIKTAKYNHLMELLEWIDKNFHPFYKSLKHSASATDGLEDDALENPTD